MKCGTAQRCAITGILSDNAARTEGWSPVATSQPIAVGVIESSSSNSALLWAASRANRLGLPLVLVHVLDDRWMVGEALPYVDVLRQSALDLLEAAAERVRSAE